MIDDPYRFFTDSKIRVGYNELGFDAVNNFLSDPINFYRKEELEKYINNIEFYYVFNPIFIPLQNKNKNKNESNNNVEFNDALNEKDKQYIEIARNNSDTWLSDKYDRRLRYTIHYSKEINTLEEKIRNNKDKNKNENFEKELKSLKEKKNSYLMDESKKKKLIAYFNESGLPKPITTQFINMVKSQNCFPFYEYMVGQDDKLEVYDKNNVVVLTLTREELESRPCQCFLKLKKVNFIRQIKIQRTKKKQEFASNKDITEINADKKICNDNDNDKKSGYALKDDLQEGKNPSLGAKQECLKNNEINLNQQHNSDYDNMEIPFQCKNQDKNQDKNSGKHSDFATCAITAGIVISLALLLLTQALSDNQSQNK